MLLYFSAYFAIQSCRLNDLHDSGPCHSTGNTKGYSMKVLRAEAMGICFGVRDALQATRRIARADEVTIYGELVHNEQLLVELDTRGCPIRLPS
jgi:pyruvate-formate lyase